MLITRFSRRPESARTRGVVALVPVLVPVLLALTSCSGTVEISSPDLDAEQEEACRDFVAALPDRLADEPMREVSPDDAVGAAYGDPAIVLTCGAAIPPEFDETQSCEVSNGVGWYVPSEVFDDQGADVTMTAVGYEPVVQLQVPGRYRPDGPAAAIAELAAGVKAHLTLVKDCR